MKKTWHCTNTEAISKLKNLVTMVDLGVIHYKNAERSWICGTLQHLYTKVIQGGSKYSFKKCTTVNSRYSKNLTFVMEPSMTVPATIPSSVMRASVDVLWPHTKTYFFSALLPFLDLPKRRAGIWLSFDVSSRKPSSSGEYFAIREMKLAHLPLSCSSGMHFSFLWLIPALCSFQCTVTQCTVIDLFVLSRHKSLSRK